MALFFTSPIGLGHITRDIAIWEKMVSLSKKNTDITLITGLKAYDFASAYTKTQTDRLSLEALNLYSPPKFFVSNGVLKYNFLWLLKYIMYYKRSKSLVRNLLTLTKRLETNSSMIISDEDFASVAVAKDLGRPSLLITDVLYTNFINSKMLSRVETFLNNSMHKLMLSCNCIIVPELGDNKNNIIYVGPIVREILSSREELRRRFLLHRKTILITTGGTYAGGYLVKKVLRVLQTLLNKFDFELILSYPYELPDLGFEAHNLRNVGFVQNIHEYIFAVDLVISLAGKSTIDECNVYGTPGIFIPIKNHFEQEERAKKFGFSFEDIFRLEKILEEHLSNIGERKKYKFKNGVTQAASIISEYLNE
jgi:UDP-N-acetylglucosamine--N-acetylmuramyl-(pentapeptide) pyrophosphoryl-undecaprenol N-acetylglucosamine transferase